MLTHACKLLSMQTGVCSLHGRYNDVLLCRAHHASQLSPILAALTQNGLELNGGGQEEETRVSRTLNKTLHLPPEMMANSHQQPV
jgi:hypothetical protein